MLIWLGLGASGSVMQLSDISAPDAITGALVFTRHLTRIALSLLLIAFIAVRVRPIMKSKNVGQRFAGILGVVLPVSLILLPRSDIGIWTTRVSLSLLLAGSLGSVAVLVWLGRSFSITPQARRLVTSGPYKYVRHPLYAAELLTVFGFQMQFLQPWAFLLFLGTLSVQILRMRFEEAILAEAFPTYTDYARRKARLIPILY